MGDQSVNVSDTVAEMWLLDISGSMHGERIEILREQLKRLLEKAPHAHLIPFNTTVLPRAMVQDIDAIRPDGGTELHAALEYAASKMVGQTVVFTDGEPSNRDACFEAAEKIPGVVHVIFCGDKDDKEAIRFCEKLSRNNGGEAILKDVAKGETLLCAEVRSLLSLPAPVAL
jgi:predicted metal-dependent peptidase